MRYGSTDVLGGIDLTAQRGEVLCLLGPNGAGKTTTIEVLESFRMRSDGWVSVLGTDPAHGDERWRAGIGIVLQSWRDHGNWKVRELLAHLGSYYRPYSTPRRPRPIEAEDLINRVGLTDQSEQRVRSLSGGQRRRLDVAIGIVGNPELLFLDEPTTGFDPQARRDFHDLMHSLADDDTTIVLTTHDLDEAEKLADRIVILAGGRVVANGSPAQLARQVTRDAEVSWTRGGQPFVHATPEATNFVRELCAQYGEEIADIEVRRATLEDVYLSMVHRHEAGYAGEAAAEFHKREVQP
ncbi:ABC transporter ATP-binding protein [Halostreptopolyspora alba]|uniref:ABC transporter ATP-binding protein n=2 Tax=Halostreptopolyspora alba TaxID=2487137 RepID=A0A3N0EGN0_9ACTN|nr:ABC transporter ATP-binding protein [Nocardiopsaceae bacterium YIM 96095]